MNHRRLLLIGLGCGVLAAALLAVGFTMPSDYPWPLRALAHFFKAVGTVSAIAGMACVGATEPHRVMGGGCEGCEERDDEIARLREVVGEEAPEEHS